MDCVCGWHGPCIYEFMEPILIIILLLALLGALPVYPYSSSWGYYPSGGLGLVLVIVILMVAFNYV